MLTVSSGSVDLEAWGTAMIAAAGQDPEFPILMPDRERRLRRREVPWADLDS